MDYYIGGKLNFLSTISSIFYVQPQKALLAKKLSHVPCRCVSVYGFHSHRFSTMDSATPTNDPHSLSIIISPFYSTQTSLLNCGAYNVFFTIHMSISSLLQTVGNVPQSYWQLLKLDHVTSTRLTHYMRHVTALSDICLCHSWNYKDHPKLPSSCMTFCSVCELLLSWNKVKFYVT